MRTNDHRLAEMRSLALHREVVERLRADPEVRAKALARVQDWIRTGDVALEYAVAWQRLLEGPRESLEAALLDDSDASKALRQTTPFSFVVGPRERWRLWRGVREAWEREP